MSRFIRSHAVKEYIKEVGNGKKQAGADFLFVLDAHIQNLLDRSIKVHNGGHKRLDAATAEWVGAKVK